jgi:FtsH-binding integral membrane protein
MVNKKMLIAPILAVALAFLLAGSVSFLPQNASSSQPSSQPTSFPGSTMQPLPTTAAVPMAESSNIIPILFGIAAIIVGAVTAFLLFSEKDLKKENSKDIGLLC